MTPPEPSPSATVHLAQDGNADVLQAWWVLQAWCGVEESDDTRVTPAIGATTCMTCLDLVASYGVAACQRMASLREDGAK